MIHTMELAPLGPNTEVATVSEWLVESGETIEAGQPLMSVETDKSIIDIEATVSGRLVRKLVDKGSVVRSGDHLAEIET